MDAFFFLVEISSEIVTHNFLPSNFNWKTRIAKTKISVFVKIKSCATEHKEQQASEQACLSGCQKPNCTSEHNWKELSVTSDSKLEQL